MSRLQGRRVLLVEDESMVAMMIEDMLLDLGCEVVVAMRLDQALAHARAHPFDMAVLDVNLGEARSYPVADLLSERGTPFAFATGYGLVGLDPGYRAVPVVQKPYQQAQLAVLLERLLTCPVHPWTGGSGEQAWAGAGPTCSCGKGALGSAGQKYRADVAH